LVNAARDAGEKSVAWTTTRTLLLDMRALLASGLPFKLRRHVRSLAGATMSTEIKIAE